MFYNSKRSYLFLECFVYVADNSFYFTNAVNKGVLELNCCNACQQVDGGNAIPTICALSVSSPLAGKSKDALKSPPYDGPAMQVLCALFVRYRYNHVLFEYIPSLSLFSCLLNGVTTLTIY